MAYCPHCAFMMPSRKGRITCPNCGRKRLKLREGVPQSQISPATIKIGAERKDSFISSLAAAVLITACGISLLAMGCFMRSPLGVLWAGIGVAGLFVGIICFRETARTFHLGKEKGFIDHLKELAESKKSVQNRIVELTKLVRRQQRNGRTERAANRLKLLNAALENRKTKLRLIEEAQFVIESKRRISKIEALAADLSKKVNPSEIERQIETAFNELRSWLDSNAITCESRSGKKIHESLQQALGLHREILEQIEDRMVMRALDDGTEPEVAEILSQIDSFLDKSTLRDSGTIDEIIEAVASDEEFIRINTELRLWKDGIKHNASSDDPIYDHES